MSYPRAIQFLSVLLSILTVVQAFPDGAPSDTCVKKRPNQPNHGKARSQPLDSNPYEVVASSEAYHPGQEVSVVIYPHTKQELFRGFFMQARDADSNEWIGEWLHSENTNTIPECSAITHGDYRDKLAAKLIWKAPQNKRGRVYFTFMNLKVLRGNTYRSHTPLHIEYFRNSIASSQTNAIAIAN